MKKIFFEKIRLQTKQLISKYNISVKYFSTNNKMMARGAFLGLYIAMIPMPFQMVAVVLLTFVGRFNLPLAISMCWLTNPVTMPFVYYIEFITGNFLLGRTTPEFEVSTQWFVENLDNIVVPLYTGAFFYAIVLSTFAYHLILNLCNKSRCKKIFISKKKNN